MLSCWTVRLNDGPQKDYDHAAVAAGHVVYSFGNCDAEPQVAVHVFNTVSLRWSRLCPPSPPTTPTGRRGGGSRASRERRRHSASLDVPSRRESHTAALIDAVVYVWGGRNFSTGVYCRTLYAFNADARAWLPRPEVSGSVPEARAGHSACVSRRAMYVFGGYVDERNGCSDRVHRLDTDAMVWALIGGASPASSPPPSPASQCHSATVIGTRMFVFGGQGDRDEDHHERVRVFDTETNLWLSTPPSSSSPVQPIGPERRACHTAFAYKGELYIVGGDNLKRIFDDLWRFAPETSSWKRVEPPRGSVLPCLRETGVCCCLVGDRVVLFGGYRTNIRVEAEDPGREGDVETSYLSILDLSPSLKTLCKLTVIRCDLEQSGLPRDLRWELAAMVTA